MDSFRRLAIVLRIPLIGKSSYKAPADATAPAAGAEIALLTSSSVILPPGPEPLMFLRFTAFSIANRLALAEMFGSLSRAVSSLPLDPLSSGSGAGVGAGADSDDVASAFSSLGGGAGADSPPASWSVKPSKALTSTPSSTRMAMG